jgi:hypothetical protein
MQNSGAEFESVENNETKFALKKSYAENFCDSDKSQKLHFSVIFSLITFFALLFCNFYYEFEINIKFCVF